MTNQEELFTQINNGVEVTRPQITIAKDFILSRLFGRSVLSARKTLHEFLVSVDAPPVEKVIIHPSLDPGDQIRKSSLYISWSLAFSEALWGLVHANFIMLPDNRVEEITPQIAWTTVYQNNGGQSAGWQFEKWVHSLPDRLILAPSLSNISHDYLIEPDLFLKHLDITEMDSEVMDALRDAILCFRAELHTPCLAMLTKAIEGAWAELGRTLVMTLDESQRNQVRKQNDIFIGQFSSIAKIIQTVIEVYGRQDFFSAFSQECGVRLDDLRIAAGWADCVRESRNIIHYGKPIDFPNDFEKVATLLLGAPAHFKLVYTLIHAGKNHARS